MNAIDTTTLASIDRRAVDTATRTLAAEGGYLSADQVEALGEEAVHWLRSRLDLRTETDDEGGVVLTPPEAATVTDDEIATLRTEAAAAGDSDMVRTCTIALGWAGSDDEIKSDAVRAEARAECAAAIADARAQQ